jgi:hypothetical protein
VVLGLVLAAWNWKARGMQHQSIDPSLETSATEWQSLRNA